MLHEEVKKYRELSGDTNPNTPISRIGGYLDGYEKALEQTRWIPVSERLPEDDGLYLVYTEEQPFVCPFEDGEFFIDEVLAWMPLPESYKAESEEV